MNQILKKNISKRLLGDKGCFILPENENQKKTFFMEYLINSNRDKRKRSEDVAEFICRMLSKHDLKILEVGIGGGYLINRLSELIKNVMLIGIDYERFFLNSILNDKINLVQNSENIIPFKNNSIDLIISEETLHSWKSPVEVINEMVRVVKPNGNIWIFDVNPKSMFFKLVLYKKWIFSFIPQKKLITDYEKWFCNSMLNGKTSDFIEKELNKIENISYKIYPSLKWLIINIKKI